MLAATINLLPAHPAMWPNSRGQADPVRWPSASVERDRQRRFEALLAPVLAPAYGAAVHMTRSREDAEDLVQEAALLAYRAFDSFQPGTNFKAWYFRILTNLFYQRHRRRLREPSVALLEEVTDACLYAQSSRSGASPQENDPAALVLGRMDAELVGHAIGSLPEEYRVVASLYFMQDFSYQEIAEIVDCPVGTVRSRLHRGRRLLQKALWALAQEQGIVAGAVAEGPSE
jgi:RNA polymerase sigma-70 factor (ECF subfamily)